jgi:hypothetical protein
MIAEIAAANAAFAVIKQALANGRELYDVSEQATKYFDSKSAIAKRASKTGGKTELQCFMELEKIKAQEEWLRDYMIYAGRPDMYSDWLKYQSECKAVRVKREARLLKEKQQRVALLKQAAIYFTVGIFIVPIAIIIFLKIFGVLK